jgi:hypothetical protein
MRHDVMLSIAVRVMLHATTQASAWFGLEVDVMFWSQQLSFIMIGVLIVMSVRNLLIKLTRFFRVLASAQSSDLIVLAMSQVMGMSVAAIFTPSNAFEFPAIFTLSNAFEFPAISQQTAAPESVGAIIRLGCLVRNFDQLHRRLQSLASARERLRS